MKQYELIESYTELKRYWKNIIKRYWRDILEMRKS